MHVYDNTHWVAAKKILRYLQGTVDLGIKYQKENYLSLVGLSESDYASDKIDRKSTSGFVFYLNDSPITWSSQKQPIVSCSSTEAEYIALATASREAVWLRNHLAELKIKLENPTIIHVDNRSTIRLARNSEFHKRTKHIDVRYHFTRELVQNQVLKLSYLSTTEQKADILTKPLLKAKFEDMVKKLGLVSSPKLKIPKKKQEMDEKIKTTSDNDLKAESSVTQIKRPYKVQRKESRIVSFGTNADDVSNYWIDGFITSH